MQQSGSDDLADAGTFLIGPMGAAVGMAMALSWFRAAVLANATSSGTSLRWKNAIRNALKRIGMRLPFSPDFDPNLHTLVDILCPTLIIDPELE